MSVGFFRVLLSLYTYSEGPLTAIIFTVET